MARSNTQNSRKWRNTRYFSTTPISPKKDYLRIRQVSKRSLKMIWLANIIHTKVAFLEIPLIPHFRFGSIAQNENAESEETFRFLINSRDFCQT